MTTKEAQRRLRALRRAGGFDLVREPSEVRVTREDVVKQVVLRVAALGVADVLEVEREMRRRLRV